MKESKRGRNVEESKKICVESKRRAKKGILLQFIGNLSRICNDILFPSMHNCNKYQVILTYQQKKGYHEEDYLLKSSIMLSLIVIYSYNGALLKNIVYIY